MRQAGKDKLIAFEDKLAEKFKKALIKVDELLQSGLIESII